MSWICFGNVSVAHGRKKYTCEWCGQRIDIGEPRAGWKGVYDGDFSEVTMHPECFDAYTRCEIVKGADNYDDELPFESWCQKRGKTILESEAVLKKGI